MTSVRTNAKRIVEKTFSQKEDLRLLRIVHPLDPTITLPECQSPLYILGLVSSLMSCRSFLAQMPEISHVGMRRTILHAWVDNDSQMTVHVGTVVNITFGGTIPYNITQR
jgi:hypothetical protein